MLLPHAPLQASPAKLTQRLTFTAIDCPPSTDCMSDDFYGLDPESSAAQSAESLVRAQNTWQYVYYPASGRCQGWCWNHEAPWEAKCAWSSRDCSGCSSCFDSSDCLPACDNQAGYCPNHCGVEKKCCRGHGYLGDEILNPQECMGVGCNGFHCCSHVPRQTHPNGVRLRLGGRASRTLGLASATAAEVQQAFEEVRDSLYSGLVVSAMERTNTSITWTVELLTPWAACSHDVPHAPLSAEVSAKVSLIVDTISGASCLGGGIGLSLVADSDATSTATAFLPWDATAASATDVLNGLLGAGDHDDSVFVERSGDGQATSSFQVTFLRGGSRGRLLTISDSTTLTKRQYDVDWTSHTETASGVSAAVEHLAPGGIDLLPLPGRYLSAPTDQTAVRVRLGHETTARFDAATQTAPQTCECRL